MAHDYAQMLKTTDELRIALTALEIAERDHPNDHYLHGQAREHVWRCYWALKDAADDGPRASLRRAQGAITRAFDAIMDRQLSDDAARTRAGVALAGEMRAMQSGAPPSSEEG